MRKPVIGVMGPGMEGEATEKDIKNAKKIGELVAKNNWVLLTGGMNTGIMAAVNKAAKESGGLTVGVTSTDDRTRFSEDLDIAIITNMRSGRNYINVLSSDIVIACGMGAGTASEVALAIQAGKQIILLNENKESKAFFNTIGKKQIHITNTPEEAIKIVKKILSIK